MLKALVEIDAALQGKTDDEKLKVLGSVSRLNPDALKVHEIMQAHGLDDEGRRQAIAAYRATVKPRAKTGPKPKK